MNSAKYVGPLLVATLGGWVYAQTGLEPSSARKQPVGQKRADWPQFRGPGGLGISDSKGLPVTWSAEKNILWKTELPGPGASSPITLGQRIFLTCYAGYGLDAKEPGEMAQLKRYLLCLNRSDGKILWKRGLEAKLPEAPYESFLRGHGYASHTPATDGERVYVFFGRSGVLAFDLDGHQLWHADVGSQTHQWGTGASPVIYKDLLIVNASIESQSLVALSRRSGREVWRAEGIREAYDTPHFVEAPGGQTELVLSIFDQILGFDPATGQRLWHCDVWNNHNMNPSIVAQDSVIYCLFSGPKRGAMAIRAGGRGDVAASHVLWKVSRGANVSSPIYHDGYLYFVDDVSRIFYCLNAKTGETVYAQRLQPSEVIYASPVWAEERLYYLSRSGRTFVLAAKPKFEQLAFNDLGDPSTFNASPAVTGGQFLLRSDRYLYCIGQK